MAEHCNAKPHQYNQGSSRKMKTALVTGSNGFIGTHLVRELTNQGYWVNALDTKLIGGINAFNTLMDDTSPKYDLVFHCAYVVGGRETINNDKTALHKNLKLDSAMFDWAERTKQPRIIYFSSSAAYPISLQTTKIALTENFIDVLNPKQPDANYGLAKIIGEIMAKNLKETTNVHVVRPFSGYGEDQSLEYPFPSLVQRAKQKESPYYIWGNAKQERDFIHIKDIINGLFAIINEDYQEPINMCTGIGTSLKHLAKLCIKEMNYKTKIKSDMSKPMGVMYRVGSPNIFHEIYKPKITIEEGVRRAFL